MMAMPINSALKLKLDELFLRWLTDRATQKVLRENLMQAKAGQSLEAMLALPTGIVVGPMSASFYGCLYSPSYGESSCLNPDGSYNSVPSAFTWGGTIASPRPNTPPYFPQPPFSKLYSPRSPRRHASTPSGLSIQIVKSSVEQSHTANDVTHENKSKQENGVITICPKVTPNSENQLSVDNGTKHSSQTNNTTATNKLLNHDADTDDISKIRTNKTTPLRTNDGIGSKQHTPTVASTPSAYNCPAESNKPDVDVVAHQQSHDNYHEVNKHYRIHSSQLKSLFNSDGVHEDVTSLISKANVPNHTDYTYPSSMDSTSCVQNKGFAIPSSPTRIHKALPAFHFPLGTTRMSNEEINTELERVKQELNQFIDSSLNSGKYSDPLISHSCFGQVAKVLNCPLYWKHAIYMNAGGTPDRQPVTLSNLLKSWSHTLNTCPDEASKFVHLLTRGRATFLVQSDFNTLIQDILESHPGLAFLEAAKDFHSRYVATVVARIFFNVNISWSGRISLGELRRSNFLPVLASLENEDDINLVTQYFSYEHFYVIYCKFWELDEDHDLIISRSDLARHNNYAISERMIDRIFSGAVTRGTAFKEGVMTYPDFVWFLLAEEDKHHPRSIEYWFRCMDLDGDGLLSMYELEYFYSEQLARMEEMGIEPISFEDCLCQCLDMVKPALTDKIRLSDMKQCRLCHIFFDTFFNLPKYLQHEQRDPFANLRMFTKINEKQVSLTFPLCYNP
ncbi:unnamed protein product [Schistosoma curassoni]|nr:unnamed protein product [Schistosoma curassoni]